MYGIGGTVQEILRSYLQKIVQSVSAHGCQSSCRRIAFRVHQRYVLGPLLSISYIIDLPGKNSGSRKIMFADDKTIIKSGEAASVKINVDLQNTEKLLSMKKTNL